MTGAFKLEVFAGQSSNDGVKVGILADPAVNYTDRSYG